MATLTLRPNGNHSIGLPSYGGSATHYLNVDEVVADDYGTYNYVKGVSGTYTDTYEFENHGAVEGVVTDVTVYARMLTVEQTQSSIYININGTTYLKSMGHSTWVTHSQSVGVLTWTQIDSLYAGMTVTTTGTRGVITQIYVVVTYSPPIGTIETTYKVGGVLLNTILKRRCTAAIANTGYEAVGVDLAQCYEKLASGSATAATGYKKAGADLNTLFCAK